MPDLFDGHNPSQLPLDVMLTMQKIAAKGSGITTEPLLVTPELADRLLKEWQYSLQRNLMSSNVERLATAMRDDSFVRGTPMFVCQTPDGLRFLVNAMHTLNAVVQSGKPIVLVLITLQVPDMAAVGKVYATFDLHRVRSMSASWKAVKGGEGTAIERTALTGLPLILSGFSAGGYKQVSRETVMETLLADYTTAMEVLQAAFTMTGQAGASKLLRSARRAGVVAVALYTARYQGSRAYEFWNYVLTESHPEQNHPTRALARDLRDAVGAGSRFQQRDINVTGQAWNLFWQDARVAHFSPGHLKTFRLLGTPWHKGDPNV